MNTPITSTSFPKGAQCVRSEQEAREQLRKPSLWDTIKKATEKVPKK